MNGRRIFIVSCGVALIVLALTGHHVEVGTLLVGLVLVGAVSGDWLAELLQLRRRDDEP